MRVRQPGFVAWVREVGSQASLELLFSVIMNPFMPWIPNDFCVARKASTSS